MGFCIKNDDVCIKNDEFSGRNDATATRSVGNVPGNHTMMRTACVVLTSPTLAQNSRLAGTRTVRCRPGVSCTKAATRATNSVMV